MTDRTVVRPPAAPPAGPQVSQSRSGRCREAHFTSQVREVRAVRCDVEMHPGRQGWSSRAGLASGGEGPPVPVPGGAGMRALGAPSGVAGTRVLP